ncbi:unnamed protein product, partial [marine sediment metagenome]
MADYIFRPYAGGESFSGQIAYPDTTLDVPSDAKRYVDSINIFEPSQYLNKHTGFE